MHASRSTAATAASQLSASSTGGTDGGTEAGGGGGAGDGCFADDSSDEGSNNGAAAATAIEEEPAMPEEVFKWMTHTVNQDFVRLGYPTILTKSSDQEFVSLCPLIRNCSSVLTLLKARRCSSADVPAAASATDSTVATAAGGALGPAASAASTLSRRKRRRWGLFSGGKQNRRGAAAGRQSATHQHQQHHHHPPQQQQQQQQQQQPQSEATDSLHESMAKKMRRDTERIIRRTRCLDAGALQTAGLREPAPYPEGSTARSDFAFVRSTWRSFRKLAQARIVECAESTKQAEELQRQLTEANAEVERLRSTANSSNQQLNQQASSTTSSQETSGRLQRVGGFLRRAVSRERLTFGRSSSRSDTSAAQQQQLGHHSETRSRASSQPPPMATSAAATSKDADTELQRVRMEFDRRERLLLSEREKLRQANSKLTFRIQYLSGLASAAAKQQQQQQQQQQQAAGGADHGVRNDRRLRRAERRVSELRRETSDLRKSLSEKTEALGNIATAAAQLQQHGSDTADKAIELGAKETSSPPPPVDEPAQLAKFVESTCQAAVSRLQRLQRQCTEAEARVAALTECLRPAAAPAAKFNQTTPNGVPSPAPSAALSGTPSVQVMEDADQTLEQTQFDLINRIKNQLAAMGLDRQDEKTRQLKDAGRAAGSGDAEKSHRSVYTETLRQLQQQQQQQRRTRRASHDPRSQSNSYFY